MSEDVTRSVEATTPGAAAAVAHRRRTAPNGVWGMLLLAATEATLFGTLLATYFYLRFRSAQWPPPGIEAPSVALPLALTAVLVATTVPMALAALAARAGRRGRCWALVALAFALQAGYLAWQIVLYLDDLDKFSPADTAYGSIYFTLLGVHHAHVAVGLLLSVWVLGRLATGLTNYRVVTVYAVALYWAFVNFLAILVVAAQVSPS
jgi:heme/copper-type cytochrome/quinol oxidase subunit 3